MIVQLNFSSLVAIAASVFMQSWREVVIIPGYTLESYGERENSADSVGIPERALGGIEDAARFETYSSVEL